MKSIKIVTYCTCSSIGSVLQAFALKKVLRDMGSESKILLEQEKKRKHNIFKPTQLCRDMFEIIMHKKINAGMRKRREFISDHMDIVLYRDYEDLNRIVSEDETDCYLAGSDQIWNPLRCDKVFFLDFIKNKRRISYAASMGNTVLPDDKKMNFVRMIKKFDKISVREAECSDIIKELTGIDSDVHIDPTFLVSAEEWRKYEKIYSIDEPYILLYMIYWDKSLKKKVKELQRKTGLKVYTIKNGLSRACGDKFLYDVGITEFLWLVDHAEYVITSSFHGVAMATVFNKKFSAVINPNSPSRIENLLRVLSIPNVEIENLNSADFDYQNINQRIIEERKRGLTYLKEAVE